MRVSVFIALSMAILRAAFLISKRFLGSNSPLLKKCLHTSGYGVRLHHNSMALLLVLVEKGRELDERMNIEKRMMEK